MKITEFEALLSEPLVSDICINGDQEVYFDRGSGLEETKATFTTQELKDWLLRQIASIGRTWDAKFPFLDATLHSGHRIHVAFPPMSEKGILVSLRRRATPHETSSLNRWQSPFVQLLVEAIQAGDSILISGATGTGKTTLASDLLGQVDPKERIIALEDTRELSPHHPHFIPLTSRPPNSDGFGEITLRTLLRQTLRMRPDRIVLGECRGNEVIELLQALNTGHKGALATLHANSPRDALRRIELLCLLSTEGAINARNIRELLSIGIQWIVQLEHSGGKRRIREIAKIEGLEGDTILMRPMVG